jgi:glutaredoxin
VLLIANIANLSSVIIFSKSYCPYSKKAKSILLNKYDILPAPYVVELDIHELGPSLQDQLEKNTGRRTVPNVLVNGKSIGGGDDIEELHNSGTLIQKIQNLTGKRVQIKAVDS